MKKLASVTFEEVARPIQRAIKEMGLSGKRVDELIEEAKTEVGEGPFEEIRGFMRGIVGVTLTAQVKEDVMGRLKLAMEHGELTLPRDDTRLLVQITNQRCEPTMYGTLKFSHPTGTHDDQFWSLALANYASQQQTRPNFMPITRSF